MNDQQTRDAIRGFLKSWVAGDTKQALASFTEDTVWVTPHGTFKGVAQAQNYMTWINRVANNYKITENGIGIIVQGNTAVIEHNLSGTTNGMKWEIPASCIWEFKNDKVASVRTFGDILTQAQQAAKGMFAKWAVNAVVNGSRKGLRV